MRLCRFWIALLLLLVSDVVDWAQAKNAGKLAGNPGQNAATRQRARERTLAVDKVNLEGVWELASYHSTIKPEEKWVGLMIITKKHLSRVYMSKSRLKLPFDHETQKLSCEQMGKVIDSYNLFRAGAGTYGLKGPELTIEPLAYYNPANFGKNPKRAVQLRGGLLYLTGISSSGDKVEEVWRKVE